MEFSTPQRTRPSDQGVSPAKRVRISASTDTLLRKRKVDVKELKDWYFKNTGTISAVGDTAIIDVAQVAAGSAVGQRLGRAIKLRGYDCRLRFDSVNQDTTFSMVRVIMFAWYDNTTPLASDILQNQISGSLSTLVSPYRIQSTPLYKILSDDVYTLSPSVVATTQPTPKYVGQTFFTRKTKAVNMLQTYADLTSANNDKSIYMLIVGGGSTAYEVFNSIRFTDV